MIQNCHLYWWKIGPHQGSSCELLKKTNFNKNIGVKTEQNGPLIAKAAIQNAIGLLEIDPICP